jgi:hypothetical protein
MWARCEKAEGAFAKPVADAVEMVVQAHPEWFDKNDSWGGTTTAQWKVRNPEAYYDAVITTLQGLGYCADRDYDLGHHIQIKDSNASSEVWGIMLSSGHVRRGRSYIETCTPAAFPVDENADLPPRGSGCGKPWPPQISEMKFYIHLTGPNEWVLDSTPITGPHPDFCAKIGYTDRFECPLRNPGDPSREACELWRVGIAKDTGLPGPTFTRNGKYCTGRESGCEHHPTNPFSLIDYEGGEYRVCAENGVCRDLLVQR